MFPALTAAEVGEFTRLADRARERVREGDLDGAERAYKRQTVICAINPDPYISLALLAASRGRDDEAVEHLRDAVVRGFTDLERVAKAESWTNVGKHHDFLTLIDLVPQIQQADARWPAWGAFTATRPPASLAQVHGRRQELRSRIEAMSPALGERQSGLWKRLIDRTAAAMLARYTSFKPEAEDAREAFDYLLGLYADPQQLRWERLPADQSNALAGITARYLEQYPDGEGRATALFARAVARNGWRDPKKGTLKPDALDEIRRRLTEVTASYPGSAVAARAAIGLIEVEWEAGAPGAAGVRFDELAARLDAETWSDVREGLGELALRVGGIPEFAVTTLDGIELPASMQGKVAVLDFWATWCGPCLEELPTLRKIEQRHGEDVMLVGINMDDIDAMSREDLQGWLNAQNVPGSQIHDGRGWESELVERFGVKEIPFNVVVDAEGQVLAVNAHGKELQKAVKQALKGR